MEEQNGIRCTAFEGSRCIASGDLLHVARETKAVIDRGEQAPITIFDDSTCRQVEIDFRGTLEDVVEKIGEISTTCVATAPQEKGISRGPGRPKLGVVAREVTLLPRHWDWLNRQPGGASVTLRKLVDEARRVNQGRDRKRQSQEVAYRFMLVMAGDQPGFEEATRALYAGNQEVFNQLTNSWPPDVRDHARKLATPTFED